MSGFLWIVAVVVVVLVAANWRDISRLLPTQKTKNLPEEINAGEFMLSKPAGFYTEDAGRMFQVFSENRTGTMSIVDGESVREEFNCAWAVVSISPGDCLEVCREVAKHGAEIVLSESTGQMNGEPSLTVMVQKKSRFFTIETTHKAIFSCDRDKTYELRASVLTSKKAEYGQYVTQMVESFKLQTL